MHHLHTTTFTSTNMLSFFKIFRIFLSPKITNMIDFELFMHEILYVMTWIFFKCVKNIIYLRTKREVLWLQTENALWNSFTIWWELRSYHLLALLNVVPSKAFLTKMSLIILEIHWYIKILLHQCSSTRFSEYGYYQKRFCMYNIDLEMFRRHDA